MYLFFFIFAIWNRYYFISLWVMVNVHVVHKIKLTKKQKKNEGKKSLKYCNKKRELKGKKLLTKNTGKPLLIVLYEIRWYFLKHNFQFSSSKTQCLCCSCHYIEIRSQIFFFSFIWKRTKKKHCENKQIQ